MMNEKLIIEFCDKQAEEDKRFRQEKTSGSFPKILPIRKQRIELEN